MSQTQTPLPMSDAPKNGERVILYYSGISENGKIILEERFSVGRWFKPSGHDTHWCVEDRWTPGPDPDGWFPLPKVGIVHERNSK